jgi:hypothetical protein
MWEVYRDNIKLVQTNRDSTRSFGFRRMEHYMAMLRKELKAKKRNTHLRTIDSCINNILYWGSEGIDETSWEPQCAGETAA